jgi:hypothetical protein
MCSLFSLAAAHVIAILIALACAPCQLAAYASAQTNVQPIVPTFQKCVNIEDWGSCTFGKNPKKPWRVDNDCKETLDKLALRLQQMPAGKLDIVGYIDQEESVNEQTLGAQRSVNVKYYLTTDGPNKVDARRVTLRQGYTKGQTSQFYFVPEGNLCSGQLEEGTVVDENAVQPQSRNAPAPTKRRHKPGGGGGSGNGGGGTPPDWVPLTNGSASPNVQGVQGGVDITVDQGTSKTKTETGKPVEKKPKEKSQQIKRTHAPSPEDSALSTAAATFDRGTIAYHPPSHMLQGSTERFELLISRTLDAGLAGKLENPKDAIVDNIRTSAVMGATLDGSKKDFSIVALGGDTTREQAIGGPEPARWEWDVTALSAGDHDLDLTVYIKVRNPSTDTVVATNLVVRHSVIHVAVRPKTTADWISRLGSFVAANWDKLWTLILLPLGAWYLHRRHKRQRTK